MHIVLPPLIKSKGDYAPARWRRQQRERQAIATLLQRWFGS
jgi:hypothetical protein